MRKLVVAAFISLDGVMQAPGGSDEDASSGFRFGGWTWPYSDDATGDAVMELFAEPFELLLGRCTYDIFAAYWPNFQAGHPIADPFNKVRKYVATHNPQTLAWNNSHALKGDVASAVRALKQQDSGTLLTQGSSDLVQQLLAAGLVDELQLQVFPLILGRGKRLFGDGSEPLAFALERSTRAGDGVLITRYVRNGEVRTGTIDEPGGSR
ncbi:MAG: dihydrofolate reductase family protein [Pseudomonadota bacterium]|nr:dihydrofolate reductase family protein [Pseudomonadota bacterium]